MASGMPIDAAQPQRLSESGTRPVQVIVLGAGLAGLAAAQALHQQGHEVLVLEGRARIGGRVWTSERWPDMPLDLGASWIHGVRSNPLTELANRIGAQRLETSYGRSRTHGNDGQALNAVQERLLETLRDQVHRALDRAQKRDGDVSVWQAVQHLRHNDGATGDIAGLLDFVLSSEFEQEYAGSATELSAHWFDAAKAFSGGDELFVRGFHAVTQALATGLNIQTGQIVREIDWSTTPVRVFSDRGAFTADRVVVTLPLGVLQAESVRFKPELPAPKRTAIARLGMGALNKCYLRFEKAFWPADVDWIEHIPTQPGVWTEWVSFLRAAGQPVLLGFNAARRARDIESWSDADTVADAMKTLRTVYGPGIPDPVDTQITRWASDPFARGSYSFNALGATPRMRHDLSQPIARKLFFAGEATEKDHFGTAHGALLSGQRVAQEVINT